MLEAAKEALDGGEGAECADDSSKATIDEIKSGRNQVGKIAERIKDKLASLGQTGWPTLQRLLTLFLLFLSTWHKAASVSRFCSLAYLVDSYVNCCKALVL